MDIVVLCGGLSAERDVSLVSGRLAAEALKTLGHRTSLVDLFFGDAGPASAISETAPDLARLRRENNGCPIGAGVLERCRAADLVFMALHGAEGENGKLQALFDICGIRYTGTGSLGSALAMDKSVAKALFRSAGIRTPEGFLLRPGEPSPEMPPWPCVVKPGAGGSSVGTTVVRDAEDFLPAVELAFAYGDEVLVERYISGRECDVGVLDGRALPVIEICPKTGFYDYKNKYQAGFADEYCPAALPAGAAETLQAAAERVFRVLRLEVYARMDFILGEDGAVYCLEANTLPGMTATSLLPQEAAAVGLSYADLCGAIVEASMRKYA